MGIAYFGIFYFALPIATMILTYSFLPRHTQSAIKKAVNSL